MFHSLRRSDAFLWVGGALVLLLILSVVRGPFGRTAQPSHHGTQLESPASETSRVVVSRLRNKSKVIEDFLEGKLTLLETAAWFRYLSDNPIDQPCNFRAHWRGDSDGEKLCRQVISWVGAELGSRMPASQVAEVIRGLTDEVESMLAESGTIDLPW